MGSPATHMLASQAPMQHNASNAIDRGARARPGALRGTSNAEACALAVQPSPRAQRALVHVGRAGQRAR
eukprot:4264274-Lingulodinium_polyedra.AAC.1